MRGPVLLSSTQRTSTSPKSARLWLPVAYPCGPGTQTKPVRQPTGQDLRERPAKTPSQASETPARVHKSPCQALCWACRGQLRKALLAEGKLAQEYDIQRNK